MRSLISRWRRTFLCVLIGIAAIGGAVINASPAGATIVQNQDWIQGYPMANIYGGSQAGAGWMCTAGPQFIGTQTAHFYMAVPRHCIERSFGVDTWVDNGSAGVCCTVAARFMDDASNYATVGNALFPWGNSGGINYTLFDMALIDFGSVTSAVAGTPLIRNWCHAYPNCAGPTGGGTGQATFGQGYNMHTTDQGTPWVGALACHSGRSSGTACGSIDHASFVTGYGGYQTWLWVVIGLGNCGVAGGDSGATVYWTEDAQNVYPFGMITTGFNGTTTTSQSACYGANQRVASSYGFIPWTSIRDGFPGLGLYPITG